MRNRSLGNKQEHTRHNQRVNEREDELHERGDRLTISKLVKSSAIWLTSKRYIVKKKELGGGSVC